MSISDKIQRLQVAKEDIATAITNKGGVVEAEDGFEEFANDIANIPAGGVPISETYTSSEGKLTAASVYIDGDINVRRNIKHCAYTGSTFLCMCAD